MPSAKAAKPKTAPKTPAKVAKADAPIGKIIHFFPNISVAVIRLDSGSLKIGEKIKIVYNEDSFEQTISSMQMEHKPIKEAKKGQEFGVKTDKPAHENALVYKVKA